MSKRPAQRRLLHVLTLSLVIILAGGGIALLYQWNLGSTSIYASSDNVVGPPSLPASYVDAIFQRVGSPMVGTGKAVEAASRTYNIDDAFALGVWWTETNDGAAGVGLADHNPGSVRGSVGYPSAFDGYTIYPSYTAAVNYWFYMLKKVYIDRGLTTVSTISHPYVGTSTSDLWAGKVITLMQRYRSEAPPFPTPTPTIAPDLKRQGQQLSQDLKRQGSEKSTYHPPVAQPVQQMPVTVEAQGLSSTTKTIVVLFDLALALGLALWAWSANKRYARRSQPAPVAPVALSPWEQMRVSGQPPSSFFNGFSGPLRNTDSLVPGLRTTEALAVSPIAHPSTEALLPVGAFQNEAAQFQSDQQTPRPAWAGQQMSLFRTPVPTGQQALPFEGFASTNSSASAFESFASTNSPDSTFESFAATSEQALPSASFPAGQQAFCSTDEQAFPADAVFVGPQTFSLKARTTDEEPVTSLPRPSLAGLSRPAQSSLHRTRLRLTSDGASSQPQPVSAGTGGGLLSRYRVQNGQE